VDLPAGPADTRPSISLRYSTGLGNGPFGMGWELNGLLSIQRRTDTGVPRYDGTDEFQLSGADVLVPVGDGYYRPRVETSRWEIRRLDGSEGEEGEGWRVTKPDGSTFELGTTPDSRVESEGRTFAWLLTRRTAPGDAPIEYAYEGDGPVRYLSTVSWGTYTLGLRYEARPDVLRDGRAGFVRVTDRRCTAIERFHEDDPEPVEAYTLRYEDAPATRLSLLVEVGRTGYGPDGEAESHPPVTLAYAVYDPDAATYRSVGGRGNLPPLSDPGVSMVDMTGDGLPDVLDTRGGEHVYWPNEGEGRFGTPRPLPGAPAGMRVGEAGVTFADTNGDGAVDLLATQGRITAVAENTGAGAWDTPRAYASQLPLSLSATDTRLTDVDGDGRVDLLQSGPGGLLWTYNEGDGGWSRPGAVRFAGRRGAGGDGASASERVVPDVALDSGGVYLADVDGDGLPDVLRVEPGRVTYWPSLGRGRWAEPVRMATPPRFEGRRRFDPDRLFVADVDGDGTADLLYVEAERVSVWLNRAGGGWSASLEVPFAPPLGPESTTPIDLYGTGTRGLLWEDARRRDVGAQYRYLDLTAGVKPYLLEGIDDGFGRQTRIEYAPTTASRTLGRTASYLPFPIHTVSSITETDAVTGRSRRTTLRFHEGYFDPVFREFRGFERVAQVQSGDEHTPRLRQVTEFDLAARAAPLRDAPSDAEVLARERALAAFPTRVRTFEVRDGDRRRLEAATTEWTAEPVVADGDRFVHAVRMVRGTSRRFDPERGGSMRLETATYEYDEYGNLTARRRARRFSDQPRAEALVTDERFGYAGVESPWLVGLLTERETRDGDGRVHRHERRYYDGEAHVGLPLGEVTDGRLRRVEELFLATDHLPDDYAGGIDEGWGLTLDEETGHGYYRERSYAHDAVGNVVGLRESASTERTFVFDDDGQFPLRSSGPEGESEATYDPRLAQPTELRTADGTVVRYEYTPLGRLRAQYDTLADGSVGLTRVFVVREFAAADGETIPAHLVSVTPTVDGRDVGAFVVEDPADITDAAVTVEYYDGSGNALQQLRRVADRDGGERWVRGRRRAYTARGEPAAEYPNEFASTPAYRPVPEDAAGVAFAYGPRGELRELTLADGRRLFARHHPSVVEQFSPSTPEDEPRLQRYDANGSLVGVAEPDGSGASHETAYEVDLDGRPLALTDAAGRRLATYTYAGPGPAVRIEHTDAGTRTYWYDGAERLRRRTDSLGRDLRYEYDGAHRLVAVLDGTRPTPTTLRTWTYDGATGRLLTATDGDVTTRYGHDAVGRQTDLTVEYPDGEALTVRRAYGRQGELRSIEGPAGERVEYEYDAFGGIAGVPGIVDRVETDASDAPARIEFAGEPRVDYAFDPSTRDLERAELTTATTGETLRRIAVGYDLDGNVAEVEDTAPDGTVVRSFAYDARSQLVEAVVREGVGGPIVDSFGYGYGPAGDVVRNGESVLGTVGYDGVDADGSPVVAGRPTSVRFAGDEASSHVEYDAAGRTVRIGNRRFAYDAFDRLVRVAAPGVPTVRFAYDASGNRVETVVGDRRTRLVGPCEVTEEASRLFVTLGSLPVAVRTTPRGEGAAPEDAETTALFVDGLGSTLVAVSLDGSTVHRQTFTPYGVAETAVEPTDRFVGGRGDPVSGVVQFGSRAYLPALGRFLTPDWHVIVDPAEAMALPLTLNPYAYAVNNPTTFRDPSGRFIVAALLVVGAAFTVGFIAGAVTGAVQGKSFGESLLMGLETGFLTAAGMVLGGATWGPFGAFVGAVNGLIGGLTENYSIFGGEGGFWQGLFAFVLDSTWGIPGTALGLLVHTWNLFDPSANYSWELSRRQNRHVYEGGFSFGEGYATTQGNVVSNMNRGRGELLNHETLHVWQSRAFGPIYQTTYIGAFVVGGVIGVFVGLGAFIDSGGDWDAWGGAIQDFAYHNNPWEVWAYHQEGPNPTGPGERGDFSLV
jgi:RHS repeat-associated protein